MALLERILEHDKWVEENKKTIPYAGPWNSEPNRKEWEHAGFSCLILRNDMLNWCGYVGIPSTHPLYGKHYRDLDNIKCHVGLTYSDMSHDIICHVADEGEKPLYWLGFDAAHGMDIVPSFLRLPEDWRLELFGPRQYRDMAYMTAEVNSLAEQLKNCLG